jgi:hypothetical protein
MRGTVLWQSLFCRQSHTFAVTPPKPLLRLRFATMAVESEKPVVGNGDVAAKATKLHGRAFYESIGSPKYVVAPMVDQSEFVRSPLHPRCVSLYNL